MADIVALKREAYKSIGIRTTKDYEYIEQYCREHLIPLWPPHWMRFDELRKKFLKEFPANRKPKENKKPTDKTSRPAIKLPTVAIAKKTKSTTNPSVTANNNNIKLNALDLATNEKPINKATATVKTEKRLSDITSKVTGTSAMTAVISTVILTPADMKTSSTTNLSNKVR